MAENAGQPRNVWDSRLKWAFAAFAIIGGFFLIKEHRAHVLPFLPWLFLAACPFIHLFMHGGHGGHGDHGDKQAPPRRDGSSASTPQTLRRSEDEQTPTHRHDGGRS